MLARLRPASPGGKIRPDRMAAKWNSVVFVSLELWLANHGDVAADHTTFTLDCAAAAKHIGRYHHSRRVQCGWLCRRGKRSRHLGGMSGSRAPDRWQIHPEES